MLFKKIDLNVICLKKSKKKLFLKNSHKYLNVKHLDTFYYVKTLFLLSNNNNKFKLFFNTCRLFEMNNNLRSFFGKNNIRSYNNLDIGLLLTFRLFSKHLNFTTFTQNFNENLCFNLSLNLNYVYFDRGDSFVSSFNYSRKLDRVLKKINTYESLNFYFIISYRNFLTMLDILSEYIFLYKNQMFDDFLPVVLEKNKY